MLSEQYHIGENDERQLLAGYRLMATLIQWPVIPFTGRSENHYAELLWRQRRNADHDAEMGDDDLLK